MSTEQPPEPLAAILTEMHDERIIRLADADVTRCLLHNLADRIEAAVERERDRLRDIVRRIDTEMGRCHRRDGEISQELMDAVYEARAAIGEGAR